MSPLTKLTCDWSAVIDLIRFLHEKNLIKEVVDEGKGIYLLQGSDRPVAEAHLNEQDITQYIEQLASDESASMPRGTTPESLLRVWVLEETGVIGWSSKRFGLRRAKRGNKLEQFSQSTPEVTELDDYRPGSHYWTAERPNSST